MDWTQIILGLATACAGAGWIGQLIENRSLKKKYDADGDQARIGNLQSVCDKQEAEISRLSERLQTSEDRYIALETKYYDVLNRQTQLIERVTTLESKLQQYEHNT